MKLLFVFASFLFCSQALAAGSTASISASAKQVLTGEEEAKASGGFSLSVWNDMGIAWWSWTGYGQELDGKNAWVSHTQGLDFPIWRLKVGPVLEWKLEELEKIEQESKHEVVIGARASLKLW